MYFTVEEENLICLYHKSDRRRTAAAVRAAMPDRKCGRWPARPLISWTP